MKLNRKTCQAALALAFTIAMALAATATHAAGSGTLAKPPGNPTATATQTPAPTATPCPSCPPIHVLGAVVSAGKNSSNSTYAVCRVVIGDEFDNVLEGITVVHRWSGAVNLTQTEATAPHPPYGTSTWVRVDNGPKCSGSNPSRVYTCTVEDVYAPGYRYAPELNVVSSDSNDACNPFD